MLLQRRLELIRKVYCQDDRPWVIAYSGGKDSTAVLQMIWLAIDSLSRSRRVKPVEIAYVDTGMEHPAFSGILSETFSKIRQASVSQGMPFRLRVLKPQLKHRYFVSVIGRGYATPTHWFRWCTKDMRIRPMTRFIKEHVSEYGQVVIVLGLRRSESHARKETLAKYGSGNTFQGSYGTLSSATAFTPIEDLSVDEVWQFLMQTPCPWGDGNRNLARLYSLASGGECPSYSLGDGLNATCGGSRFGCWTCTVVRRDRAGEGLAEDDDRYELLLEFRNWLSQMRYERKRRWNVRRNGAPGPGPLRLSTRREILRKLVEIQTKTGFPLLLNEELVEIQRLWRLDGDVKETAFQIWAEHFDQPPMHKRKELYEIKPLPQKLGQTLPI